MTRKTSITTGTKKGEGKRLNAASAGLPSNTRV